MASSLSVLFCLSSSFLSTEADLEVCIDCDEDGSLDLAWRRLESWAELMMRFELGVAAVIAVAVLALGAGAATAVVVAAETAGLEILSGILEPLEASETWKRGGGKGPKNRRLPRPLSPLMRSKMATLPLTSCLSRNDLACSIDVLASGDEGRGGLIGSWFERAGAL